MNILICRCARCKHEWITKRSYNSKICPNCLTKFWNRYTSIYIPDLEIGSKTVIGWPRNEYLLIDAINIYAKRKGIKFIKAVKKEGVEIERIS